MISTKMVKMLIAVLAEIKDGVIEIGFNQNIDEKLGEIEEGLNLDNLLQNIDSKNKKQVEDIIKKNIKSIVLDNIKPGIIPPEIMDITFTTIARVVVYEDNNGKIKFDI